MSRVVALLVTLLLIQWSSYKLIISNGSKASVCKTMKEAGDALILTPYIECGLLDEAKEAAKVKLDVFQNVTSYSGYLTVDAGIDANLFFWFFPSEGNYDDPVVLWLQGGPGASSLFGLFVENGPFAVDGDKVTLRDTSWTKNHSVLYIDQPVGTGFSFTNGHPVTNQSQVGEHLYSALIQFFTLFSEYQQNEFYISGESYAGKYVPAIGYAILQNNPNAILTINLQGLIIVSGMTDPQNQIDYGDMLFQRGLIDLETYELFEIQQHSIIHFIETENYTTATTLLNELNGYYFEKYTGLHNVYNFVKDVIDTPTAWADFVNKNEVKEALHVGNRTYQGTSPDVYYGLYDDITKSVAPWVSKLLKHYRVLLMNGQLDIITGYPLIENYLLHLNFISSEDYATASRSIWTVNNMVAGYVKVAGNLTEVMVRNAGHMLPMDQPVYALDLLTKFVRNLNIA